MKHLMRISLLLAFCSTSFAAETALEVLPQNSVAVVEATSDIATEKGLSIFLGFSSLNDGDDSAGNGIFASVDWYLNRYIGFGGSFSNYDATKDNNFSIAAAYLRAVPVQYTYESVKFAALASLGGSTTKEKYSPATNGLYFGGGLEANFNNQVGVRLEQTIGDETTSQTSLGFVGYY